MPTLDAALKELTAKMENRKPITIDAKQRRPSPSLQMPPTVTPYLPKEAEADAQAWQRSGKAAFVKAYEQAHNQLVCPNCQGVGFVMLNLASGGPFSSPPSGGVITWFDGNDRYGKGWYRVEKTLAYDCPECKKRMQR